MATSAKVAFGTIGSTTSDTCDLTVSGFGTPTAAIIVFADVTAADNPKNNATFSVGFWTSGAQCVVGLQSVNGQATSRTGRFSSSADAALRIIAAVGGGNATVGSEMSAAAITDGIRLTVDTSTLSTLSRYVYALLISGTTNVSVGSINLGTGTSAIDITSPGFRPDLVLFSSICSTSVGGSSHMIASFGAAHNDGTTTNQGVSCLWAEDSQADSDTGSYINSGYVAGQVFNGSVGWLASVSDFDASGFSITPSADASSDTVFYMALELADANDAYVGIVDSRASTGTQAYTGTGFTPSALWLLQTMCTATATVTGQGSLSFGASDGARSITLGVADENTSATSDSQARADTSNVISLDADTGALDMVASLSSFDSDGWTLNYSDGSASVRKMLALAIGDSTAGGSAPTLSDLQAVSITSSSVQGTYDYAF